MSRQVWPVTDSACDWPSVLRSLISAPSSFRRRQRNPRSYDKRRSESDVALFYHLLQSYTYQLKRGELQKSALPSALEVIEAAVRPGERTRSPGRDAHCLQRSGFLMALASLFHHLTLSESFLQRSLKGHMPCALRPAPASWRSWAPCKPAPLCREVPTHFFCPECIFPDLWSPGSLLTRWVHTCDEIPNEPSSPRNLLSSGGRLTSPLSGL